MNYKEKKKNLPKEEKVQNQDGSSTTVWRNDDGDIVFEETNYPDGSRTRIDWHGRQFSGREDWYTDGSWAKCWSDGDVWHYTKKEVERMKESEQRARELTKDVDWTGA